MQPQTSFIRQLLTVLILAMTVVAMVTGCIGTQSAIEASDVAELPSKPPTSEATVVTPNVVPETPGAATTSQAPAVFGYTYQQPNGNRLMPGRGALPGAQPVDIPLAGEPLWLVGAPFAEGSLWVVVLADGRVQAFEADGPEVSAVDILPRQLPPGMPPLLKIEADLATLITAPSVEASSLTHPVILNTDSHQMAYVEADGDVVIEGGRNVVRLALNALPDARLLLDEKQRLLLLTDATTRYGHGVLGDAVEAASITLVETAPTPRVALTIPIPAPAVVEGIAPIWADLTGNGGPEIIVTLSDGQQGARVVVFDQTGEQIAAGPAIGRGNRWRHQLVVAPFGPGGELELADVLTPHIRGVLEFYQLVGGTLRIVARVPGYTSHAIGSRNLDTAVAGDFDGDDRLELLIPNQARTELGAIGRTPEGAEVVWRVPVGGQVSTNLAAVRFSNGRLAVGVGQRAGKLRLWLP